MANVSDAMVAANSTLDEAAAAEAAEEHALKVRF